MNGGKIRMRETPLRLLSGSQPALIESSIVRIAFSHNLNSTRKVTTIVSK